MHFEIREVDFGDHREEIGELRAKVWIEEGSLEPSQCPGGLWLDQFEANSMHWAALAGNKIVASARLTVSDRAEKLPYGKLVSIESGKPIALLSRLVVSKEARGNGLARELDRVRLARATELGASYAWGIFPNWRFGPLEKIGFETVREMNPEENEYLHGYRHNGRIMRKNLA